MKYSKILVILLMSATATWAQNATNAQVVKRSERAMEMRAKLKERVKIQHTAFITQRLELTEAEAAQFWAIFNEYQAKLDAIRQSAKQTGDPEKLTDAEAEKWIAADFDRQARELDLKREYFQRFKKVLPAAKIFKLHRAEREFRLLVAKRLGERKKNMDEMPRKKFNKRRGADE